MSNIKVSIIISVYNGEKFIKNAVDSVINQSLKEIEIIIINDGSTDKTLKILDSYTDNRIKIINQENIGLGASRNKGINLANGQYIMFLDADDFLTEDACKIAYEEASQKDTDITMFQIINYDYKTKTTTESQWFNLANLDSSFDNKVFSPKDTKDVLFDFSVSACQRIYKTSFIKNLKYKFPVNMYFEDMPFFYSSYLTAKRISIIRQHLYYRGKNESSITEKVDKKFLDTVPAGQEMFKRLCNLGFYEEYKFDLIAYKINGPRMALSSIDENYQEDLFKLIKEDYEEVKDSIYYQDFLDNLGPKKKKFFQDILKSKNYTEFKQINNDKTVNLR